MCKKVTTYLIREEHNVHEEVFHMFEKRMITKDKEGVKNGALYNTIKQDLMPMSIKDYDGMDNVEELLHEKPACISFREEEVAVFSGAGSYVVLDFGKEICGGVRLVTRTTLHGMARFRICFGESLSEAYSSIGEKNATNDHSPRDFAVDVSNMSDLTFGMSGFRFARIELLTEHEVWMQNIFAVNTLPYFEKEAVITTSDEELNHIIETATYTLKLNLQNGYIWDGIKRDRLVWCGDLNQEIITSIYLFGDNSNVTNSLAFLRNTTLEDEWINWFPSYSAWWVINLCDYCRLTGNQKFFEENRDYAKSILSHLNRCIDEDGNMDFELEDKEAQFFLDWSTFKTADALIGTAMILICAAKAFLRQEDNEDCLTIMQKLARYLDEPCEFKQTRAFQILAGKTVKEDSDFLEKDGAKGFSTFMAYYILCADALAGGEEMLPIIKEYFGAMLSRGATTFWEDFHMEWLEGSGRIDELPKEGEKDLHGDYGDFCYKGFRHSLCHGWASGVLAFVIEHIVGLKLKDGGKSYELIPNTMGIERIEAKIPVKDGWLDIKVIDGVADVKKTII